eukprot:8782690-Lingulodinium_polyedra.AAC.1
MPAPKASSTIAPQVDEDIKDPRLGPRPAQHKEAAGLLPRCAAASTTSSTTKSFCARPTCPRPATS